VGLPTLQPGCSPRGTPRNDSLRWPATRQGVRFHDSEFDADAVIWNPAASPTTSRRNMTPRLRRSGSHAVDAGEIEKADDKTIVLTTQYPFSFLPYLLPRLLIASPTQWEKVGKTWAAFAKEPSGTGPFRITKVVLGQYAEMSRNDDYWDKARVPKLDKMIAYPMAESTTRVAALRSGQVDWIEVPPPDSIPSLKQAGLQVSLWPYPHTYPYALSCLDDSPFKDVRVRQAINYAVDREGLCKLLNGSAKPAYGLYPPDNPVFGTPQNRYGYDPEKAKALLKEAGYGPGKPVKAKIMISTSGSGQMMPVPMNEFMQQNFKAVGMEIDFDVVEWGTMLVAVRNAPTAPQSHGDHGINISLSYTDPSSMFRYYAIDSFSPTNYNWGHWSNQRFTDLVKKAQATFDPAEQTKLLAAAHTIVVDEAPWLFIVHDLNPRAMNKKVAGFHPAQSWYQDFTQISMV
jgi:ABC-type transport system substrate-binding protein